MFLNICFQHQDLGGETILSLFVSCSFLFCCFLISLPETIPQQHLHSRASLLPHCVLSQGSAGCLPAPNSQVTSGQFCTPHRGLQNSDGFCRWENWVMGKWNHLLKATQLVRDRTGCQIQGFSSPGECFLLWNGTCFMGASRTHPSAWHPLAGTPRKRSPSHLTPTPGLDNLLRDGEGPRSCFSLPKPRSSLWWYPGTKTLSSTSAEKKNYILHSWIGGNLQSTKTSSVVHHPLSRQTALSPEMLHGHGVTHHSGLCGGFWWGYDDGL